MYVNMNQNVQCWRWFFITLLINDECDLIMDQLSEFKLLSINYSVMDYTCLDMELCVDNESYFGTPRMLT